MSDRRSRPFSPDSTLEAAENIQRPRPTAIARALRSIPIGLLLGGATLSPATHAADNATPASSAAAATPSATSTSTTTNGANANEGTLPTVNVTAQNDTTHGYVAKTTTSATKTNTSILETPQSVSVVTRDQMDQQDAQTLNAAVRYVSGVTPETRGGIATRYDLLTIRGFSADTYLDGLKVLNNNEYAVPQFDPYFMDTIDVLKGPVSVLYGSAQAGGVLDQQSKMPTAQPLHEIGIEFGNYAHKQATVDLSGPIAGDDHYLYRFTALVRKEDGQVESTENERIAIAPAFTWRPDDKTSLTLLAKYDHDPRSTSYGSVPPQGTTLPNPNGKLPYDFYDGDPNFENFDRVEESIGYKFQRLLNDTWTFRSNARYLHLSQDYKSVYASALESDLTTLDRGTAMSSDTLNTVSLDNQLEGNFATGSITHTVLAGFDYQHLNSGYLWGFGSAPSIDMYAPDYNLPIVPPEGSMNHISSTQYGLYLQDQARWNNWLLTLSGRQDWSHTDTLSDTYGTAQNQSDRAFTKRAGLTYLFANGLAPYVSYTESFSPQAGTSRTGKAFDPERAHQYEIGIKFAPPKYDMLFTAALFDLTRTNLLTTDLVNPNFQTQTGEARSRGLELEAKVSLTDSLNVTAAYTYLDTKYIQDNSGLAGKYVAAIPQNQASAWAYYTLNRGPLAGLSFGAGGRYTGTTYSTDNSFEVQSYFLVDATLRYDLGRASSHLKGSTLYVNAQNLLNKEYVASCYYGSWCAYGYGRQVMAGVNYKW
ncbi:TonB-dependent siderophore receptor [Pararobbsia silviterrae]|uniref:TonB-dependent siderophore receptor n=1 Tax=Pararobbsia silviterrae TaxID=1792498 RepID=A0A494XV01_9BURK|nr:TonB-dependent siderophore receptor [Pararobbsia silviterrae]RKP53664.1 TonB-dependent siderophore receptor [Pararobbsia silviterrae]